MFEASDEVDVGLYDAFDKPVNVNEFLMCCYLNIGFEPRVGARKYTRILFVKIVSFPIDVERHRKKSRCLNKLNYFIWTIYEAVWNRRRN